MKQQLNVIGFISGGKDSFFSLLHCLANGHKVVALANLCPPDHARRDQDLNSLMYQTVGYGLVPLYEEILSVPLYRHEIRGSAINQARDYRPPRLDLPKDVANPAVDAIDETESMVAILYRILEDFPEANAVCSGAILSTYQRTRIESIASRMHMVSLAYLWQYAILPTPIPREQGLLEDMAAVGLDARIVKVASGGLDEDLLLENVCLETTRKVLARATRRFGGSILGEGGEYETFVVDGPHFFSKGALHIKKEDGKIIRSGGGEAWMTFTGGCIEWKKSGQKDNDDWRQRLRMPDLLDDSFQHLLTELDQMTLSSPIPDLSLTVPHLPSQRHNQPDQSNISWGDRTIKISNLAALSGGDDGQVQMLTISKRLTHIIDQVLRRSVHDIVFTTIALRSMDDFSTVNSVYSDIFSGRPGPPARVTIAAGESLPKGTRVMISVLVSLQPRTLRQSLHVQSLSYWAPANIGPYSQAVSVPFSTEGTGAIVYVAGQIPLHAASMEIASRTQHNEWPSPVQRLAEFRLQTTVALQHLWRIGKAMSVGWWIGATAFVVSSRDDIKEKAFIAGLAWKMIHASGTSDLNIGYGDTDDADFDVWDQQRKNVGNFAPKGHEIALPDLSCISKVNAKGSNIEGSQYVVPPFFAVEVSQLPRHSEIEWQSLGIVQTSIKVFDAVTEGGISVTVCMLPLYRIVVGYIGIEQTEVDDEVSTRIEQAILFLQRRCNVSDLDSAHKTIYTSCKINAVSFHAQLVPCKSVWDIDGKPLAVALIVEHEMGNNDPSSGDDARDMSINLETPQLNVHPAPDDEKDVPNASQRLSRSPHPYARWRPHTQDSCPSTRDGCVSSSSAQNTVDDLNDPTSVTGPKAFVDVDNRKRRKVSTSPSDSGTEADDESGPFLKGLPAPPTRLRKGLKDDPFLGTLSPLLTPSYLDDTRRRDLFEAQVDPRADVPNRKASHGGEASTERDKFRRRRRAELIRRITETILLLSIGCLTCGKTLLLPIGKEIFVAISVVVGIYSLYPFRLFFHHYSLPMDARGSRAFLRIPAAFDPATLLYPVLLPLFVAASLTPQHQVHTTLNVVLCIASMPRAIVPSQDTFSGHTSVQWMLSLLPISRSSAHDIVSEGSSSISSLQPEVLALLYPLHQALMPTLGYLTTTSLLPAELQLCSVALINVLLLSSSPPALILQALLWGGGLCLFILCRKVLEWEVVLARIPSWRFRGNRSHGSLQLYVERVLKRLSQGRLSFSSLLEDTWDQSDDDEPRAYAALPSKARRRGFSITSSDVDRRLAKSRMDLYAPADDMALQLRFAGPDYVIMPNDGKMGRQRSSTLPAAPEALSENVSLDNKSLPKLSLLPVPLSKKFRYLTKAEAAILKWFYALYTYTIAIVIIAVPIRSYLGAKALHDQEPLGWALGYLLGDIYAFRSFVIGFGLGKWIRLPLDTGAHVRAEGHGFLDEVRWQKLGAATTRLLICVHCLCTIGLGLGTVIRLSTFAEVDTRRKVFHGMMVVMFLPTIFVDPTFIALALTLVLAVFLLLDLFRASQLPPLSRPLTNFLAPYVDGRDHRGPVIVSHIFLLIGCSIPLWLSLASLQGGGQRPWEGWEVPTRDVSMISGVVCVGMGDAAASLIGRRFGRRRWCWSGGKSIEGSAAFAIAVVLGLSLARTWLHYGGWPGATGDGWPIFFCKATIAASGASLTEAVLTGGNDNVIVPVILWLLVRGLGV
ncbi:MAG: hypothetical protein Q9174_002712 [Haloplaca sp. 1 TL-2023]